MRDKRCYRSLRRVVCGIIAVMYLICSIDFSCLAASPKKLTSDEIRSYFYSRSGAQNSCLAFLANGFQALGAERSSACCAHEYRNIYLQSSDLNNIPIGADVFFVWKDNYVQERLSHGNVVYDENNHICDHVGVYIGNGEFVDNGGRRNLSDYINNNQVYCAGWGIHGNVCLNNSVTVVDNTIFSRINATEITDCSAHLRVDFDYSKRVTNCGFIIGRAADLSDGTVHYESDKNSSVSNGVTTPYIEYDTSNWHGNLLSGTKYYYQFFVQRGGVTVKSAIKSFTTSGGQQSTEVWNSNITTPYHDHVTSTNAEIGFTVSSATNFQNCGFAIATKSDMSDRTVVLESPSDSSYSLPAGGKAWYGVDSNGNPNLSSKWGITLSPGTTYYYQTFVKISGTAYFSSVQSFTTLSNLVTKVTLDKTTASIKVGGTTQLTATVSPSNATNKGLTWKSSDTSIATVSSSGLVTGIKPGTVTITATAKDGSGKKATCTVTVNAILVTSVTMSSSTASVKAGGTTQLSATVAPTNATNKGLTWTSSDTSIATVNSSGLVTGVKPGTVTITATAKDGSGKKATCTVTVNPVLVTSVTMNSSTGSVNAGSTLQLSATVAPTNATNKGLTWTSSDTSIATVNSSGLVTGVKPGTVTITATAKDGSGKKATCTVTVNPVLVTSVTMNSSTGSVNAGSTLQLSATVVPTNATNKGLTWTSSNTSIATVNSSGLVTGVKPGTVTITATAKDGSGKKATCTVTVNPVLVTSVTMNSSTGSVNAGSTLQLSATVAPANATNKGLTWTSSDTSIATVNSSGLVTGVKPGSVTITATAKDGSGKKATCTLTVNPVLVTGITLDVSEVEITRGETYQLHATVVPSNATNRGIAWTSSDTSIATVNTSGLVTGVKPGTVTITATAKDGSGKNASCTIIVVPSLSIMSQPIDCTVGNGRPFTFSVQAEGNGLSYNWKYQWPGQNAWISWANGKTDTLTGTMQAGWDGLKVKCVISDANGNSVESTTAMLNLPAVTIEQQPADVSSAAGSPFAFSVAATGTGLSYDWKYQWPGQNQWYSWNNGTTDTLIGTMQAGWDGLKVKCVISDANGNSVESTVVMLNLTAVTIEQQPSDVSSAAGTPFMFSIVATGTGLTYDWKYQWPGQNQWYSWNNGKTDTLIGTMQAGWDGLKVKCVISDANGNNVESTVAMLNLTAVTIEQQPADVSSAAGSPFTFSVAATGTGLTYDWKYQWPGQNQWYSWNNGKTDTLTGTMQAGWDGLKVKCVICDANGNSVESTTAMLNLTAVMIEQQPADASATAGSPFTFSVAATGTGLTYDWKYQWPGQNQWYSWNNGKTDTLTGTMQVGWDGLKIKCVITDANGNNVESTVATLNLTAVTIEQQPADVSATAGSPFTFSVAATGTGLTYDWKYQWLGQNAWISWSNGKTDTLTGTMQAGWDGLKVKCVISDANGNSVESETVTLGLTAVSISQQPSNVSVAAGSPFTFSIVAAGTGLSYDWKYQWPGQNVWISWSNGKTDTLIGTMQAGWDGLKVKCIVTDNSGNVTESDTVLLSLSTSLAATLQSNSYNTVAEQMDILFEQVDESVGDITESADEVTEESNEEISDEDIECSTIEVDEDLIDDSVDECFEDEPISSDQTDFVGCVGDIELVENLEQETEQIQNDYDRFFFH